LLDRNGLVLTMAQTWHQVRPGEVRTDCGGCHAHSQQPLDFAETAAAQPGYQVWDLVAETPLLTQTTGGEPALRSEDAGVVNVEFYRDIRPILQRSCVQCHTQADSNPPGNLVLDDLALYDTWTNSGQQVPGDYKRLCQDSAARWGYPPLVRVGDDPVWRQTNASRYVRLFQSRRSLLIWKIFGQRLDGWSNDDHPTEAVPGDASALPSGPEGAPDPNLADLDFTGTIMPPLSSGAPPLSIDEKMTFARWVDLGCPINTGEGENANYGWFSDDVRPALDVSSPRPGANTGPLNVIRVGVADAYTGIAAGSLSIKADFAVNGRAPGVELADLAQAAGEGVYTINLATPLLDVAETHLFVQVADNQGNLTRVDQQFSVAQNGGPTATPSPIMTLQPTPTLSPTLPPGSGVDKAYLPLIKR
jgi:hypothetical protein